jgi:general secretion pathway protein I
LFRSVPPDRSSRAGFTLLEALIALAILSVALTAMGSLISASLRATRSLDERFALIETARTIEAGLPDRQKLQVGRLAGEIGSHHWRVDVSPYLVEVLDPKRASPWLPLKVVLTVRGRAGQTIQLSSVRLQRRMGR